MSNVISNFIKNSSSDIGFLADVITSSTTTFVIVVSNDIIKKFVSHSIPSVAKCVVTLKELETLVLQEEYKIIWHESVVAQALTGILTTDSQNDFIGE